MLALRGKDYFRAETAVKRMLAKNYRCRWSALTQKHSLT